MIPDEAIEALARVLAHEALFDADMAGTGWNAETDSSDHFMPRARVRARRYLEAAVPHLMAQVWDDALEAGEHWCRDLNPSEIPNPYRKESQP